MRLNEKDEEKLMLHMAGSLAKERRARGLKLNYPEAVALISSELLELARDGHDVAELMSLGRHILTADDVMTCSVSVAEEEVKGIGEAKFEKMKDKICI